MPAQRIAPCCWFMSAYSPTQEHETCSDTNDQLNLIGRNGEIYCSQQERELPRKRKVRKAHHGNPRRNAAQSLEPHPNHSQNKQHDSAQSAFTDEASSAHEACMPLLRQHPAAVALSLHTLCKLRSATPPYPQGCNHIPHFFWAPKHSTAHSNGLPSMIFV